MQILTFEVVFMITPKRQNVITPPNVYIVDMSLYLAGRYILEALLDIKQHNDTDTVKHTYKNPIYNLIPRDCYFIGSCYIFVLQILYMVTKSGFSLQFICF